jgi:hypothetical protein
MKKYFIFLFIIIAVSIYSQQKTNQNMFKEFNSNSPFGETYQNNFKKFKPADTDSIKKKILETEQEIKEFEELENLGYDLLIDKNYLEAIKRYDAAIELYNKTPRNTFHMVTNNKQVTRKNKFSNPAYVYYFRAVAKYFVGDIFGACYDASMFKLYSGNSNYNESDLNLEVICNISALVSNISIPTAYSINDDKSEKSLSAEKQLSRFYLDQALKDLKTITSQSSYEDFKSPSDYLDKAIDLWNNNYYVFFKGLVYELNYITTGATGALLEFNDLYEKAAEMGSELAKEKLNRN